MSGVLATPAASVSATPKPPSRKRQEETPGAEAPSQAPSASSKKKQREKTPSRLTSPIAGGLLAASVLHLPRAAQREQARSDEISAGPQVAAARS